MLPIKPHKSLHLPIKYKKGVLSVNNQSMCVFVCVCV